MQTPDRLHGWGWAAGREAGRSGCAGPPGTADALASHTPAAAAAASGTADVIQIQTVTRELSLQTSGTVTQSSPSLNPTFSLIRMRRNQVKQQNNQHTFFV